MEVNPVVTLNGLVLDGTDELGVEWYVPKGGLRGWFGSPAPRMSLTPRSLQHGVWAGDSWLEGRTVVIDGKLAAPTQALAEEALDRLATAAALADVDLSVAGAAGTRRARVRRSDEVLPEEVNALVRKFSVQVFAKDPRRLGDALTASTGLPASSGGLTLPFTVPFSIDSTVESGQVSLVNPGNIDGPVTLRIDGPVVGPRITHVNSGRSLVFASSLDLGAGEFLIVDMQARQVLAQGQASRNGWVTERGWHAFQPGVNIWAFASTGPATAGTLTVTASPAWM